MKGTIQMNRKVVLTLVAVLVFGFAGQVKAGGEIGPLLNDDLVISTTNGTGYQADVAFGGGRFLIVWAQYYDPTTYNYDIYGRFITSSGEFDGEPFLIVHLNRNQTKPSVSFNGTNYLVTYAHDTENRIKGQILKIDGTLVGNSFNISFAQRGEEYSEVASDGTNFLVVWMDNRNKTTTGYTDIYGQFVSGNGSLVGSNFRISDEGNQNWPSIHFGSSNYLITWENEESTDEERDIYGVLVDTSGDVSDRIAIATQPGTQGGIKSSSIAYDNITGNYFVAWNDYIIGESTQKICGKRISDEGILLDGPSPESDGILIAEGDGSNVAIGFDGYSWLVVWAGYHIRGARVSIQGELIDESPIDLYKNYLGGQWYPGIASDGTNHFVTWYVSDSNNNFTTYGQLIGPVPIDETPIADAGADQTVDEETLVTLDGSGSSDPDNDPLTYSWSQIVGPSVSLDITDPIHPSFTAPPVEVGGAPLTFQLTVSDGELTSEPDSVSITVKKVNAPPIANAGADQTVHHGTMVSLDGSDSSDPDKDYPLTYAWTMISQPSGSNASLIIDDDPSIPSFIADAIGDYTIELVVTDSNSLPSAADQVLVSTFNTPPVADAGEDQVIIQVETKVQLDGSQSYDYEGDDFTYLWTITQRPAESIAVLNDHSSSSPTFIADVHGDYVISLTVTDIFGAESDSDSITVSFENVKPVADAGGNQSVIIGDTVFLDVNGSYDKNFDPLSYSWNFVSKPSESLAELSGVNVEKPSFIVDKPGAYVVSLVVNDTFVDSDPANVTIMAITTEEAVAIMLIETVEKVNLLDPESLKNKNLSNALTNKINAALAMIDEGLYEDALDKLEDDILGKTNGCAEIDTPDKNDWIKTCDAQNQIYPQIVEVIELLRDTI